MRVMRKLCGMRLSEKSLRAIDIQDLEGPFSETEVSAYLNTALWVLSFRFALRQKTKLRPIDDFARSLVNATVTTREKVSPDSVDVIEATAAAAARTMQISSWHCEWGSDLRYIDSALSTHRIDDLP
eukprot:6490831-Amphidinium_carterae.4